METDIEQVFAKVYANYLDNPIDIMNIGDQEGEHRYLNIMRSDYLRTIWDISRLFSGSTPRTQIKILEVGSFMGVVAVALANLGFAVHVFDIPEFQNNETLKKIYVDNNIHVMAGNLKNLNRESLPYPDDYFDCVVTCETIEHLNFNPLRVLYDINRIIKHNDGYFYVSVPNLSRIRNRLSLLFGKSIYNKIDDYFRQLDRNDNMIVGLHWREYTLSEIKELFTKMGFQIIKAYFWNNRQPKNVLSLLKNVIDFIPSFKNTIVVLGQKLDRPKYNFWYTEANR